MQKTSLPSIQQGAPEAQGIARALGRAWQGPLFWYLLWSFVWAVGFGLLALAGPGCAPRVIVPPSPGLSGVSSASVVTLLRVRKAEPLDERQADTYEPACSAFAVRSSTKTGGRVLLVTAAHCAEHALGAELRYYAPDGVGHDQALLVARDSVRDLAVLEPRDPSPLVPLELAPVPSEGEHTLAVSSVYDQSAPGVVVDTLREGWIETSQSVVYGWSGSPELDAHGRVWGLVSRCPTEPDGANETASRCVPGHTYVAALLREGVL